MKHIFESLWGMDKGKQGEQTRQGNSFALSMLP